MDNDFRQKLKRKRLRAIALVVVIVSVAVFLILDTKFEKADYTKSLQKEIETAQSLLSENQSNSGNKEGQYAPYTLLAFNENIKDAVAISKSEDSQYEDKKNAYEALKEQVDQFKEDTNKQVISAAEMEKFMFSDKKASYTTKIKGNTNITYSMSPSKIKSAKDINLMAREKGPYYETISEILSRKSLTAQVISFYQDGDFGGTLTVKAPLYQVEGNTEYVYSVDFDKEKLVFVSEGRVDKDSKAVTFDISKGGDYVITAAKLYKDDVKVTKETGKTNSHKHDKESAITNDKKEEMITVAVEIRCDTLAEDLSKLTDKSLEDYVPKDGAILKTTKVKVKKGSTGYDVLNQICRNKGIQVEASYTPAYGSYYVEGINYLYEFDGGSISGWMYRINDTFPNYGCSEYVMKDGDKMSWLYTCDLGKDVGNGM